MNKISLSGRPFGEIKYAYERYGEKFYETKFISKRKSGNADIVDCIVPEILIDGFKSSENISLIGEIRTRNIIQDGAKNKLCIYVFVKEISKYSGYDENSVSLEGFICKQAQYRETPLGRQISDFFIASNRHSCRSDYIPCITWGRNAVRISELGVGTKINLRGRLQSRDYIKKLEDGTEEMRTAYELSVAFFEVI